MLRSRLRPGITNDSHQPESRSAQGLRPSFDWRGWIILAWVVWFGIEYGKMVLAHRSDKIASMVARLLKSM